MSPEFEPAWLGVNAQTGNIEASPVFLEMLTARELLACLAHEVGHIALRHVVPDGGALGDRLQRVPIASEFIACARDRHNELAADNFAIKAGAQPSALVSALEKLSLATAGVQCRVDPLFGPSHPKLATRKRLLQMNPALRSANLVARKVALVAAQVGMDALMA